MAPRENHSPQVATAVHQSRPLTTPKAEKPVANPVTAPVVATEAAPTVEAPVTAKGGELILPPTVISRADLGKCVREIEKIDDYFHQEGLRGRKDQPLPTLGRTLENVASVNGLNLIHAEDRSTLKSFLTRIKVKAPAVHMSFPSEASDDFIAKLLEWFRKEVNPYIVLNVGLQPELAAGCTLRTTNKFYDFSFRHRFEASKQKLMASLEALDKAPETTKVADANATNQPTALTDPATAGTGSPAATEPVAEATVPATPAAATPGAVPVPEASPAITAAVPAPELATGPKKEGQ